MSLYEFIYFLRALFQSISQMMLPNIYSISVQKKSMSTTDEHKQIALKNNHSASPINPLISK